MARRSLKKSPLPFWRSPMSATPVATFRSKPSIAFRKRVCTSDHPLGFAFVASSYARFSGAQPGAVATRRLRVRAFADAGEVLEGLLAGDMPPGELSDADQG